MFLRAGPKGRADAWRMGLGAELRLWISLRSEDRWSGNGGGGGGRVSDGKISMLAGGSSTIDLLPPVNRGWRKARPYCTTQPRSFRYRLSEKGPPCVRGRAGSVASDSRRYPDGLYAAQPHPAQVFALARRFPRFRAMVAARRRRGAPATHRLRESPRRQNAIAGPKCSGYG